MKILNTRLKKASLIVIISIIVIGLAAILFISPIVKFILEKYDEKWTGRKIKTGLVYVNPFTGYIHISNLKIYESKERSALTDPDSIFFSAKGLSVDVAMLKVLSKTFEITEFTLDRPKGIIIQNKKEFNFSDLIKKFTPSRKILPRQKFRLIF
jgi:hypothetical protein